MDVPATNRSGGGFFFPGRLVHGVREVVELWDEVLGALERGEMERLVGRLDWVTKRFLLERVDDILESSGFGRDR